MGTRQLPATIVPRAYQQDGLADVVTAYAQGRRRMVIELPTASGKTLLALMIILKFMGPFTRVLFMVPTIDLVEQTLVTFLLAFDRTEIGLVQGKSNEVGRRIIIASEDTLDEGSRMFELLEAQGGRPFDIVFTDEAHLQLGLQHRLLPQVAHASSLVLALSATPYRADRISLGAEYTDGLAYYADILDLIAQNHLARIHSRTRYADLELSDSELQNPEISPAQLARMKASNRYEMAYQDGWVDFIKRRPTVVFAQSLGDAYGMAEFMADKGIEVPVVDYRMSGTKRRAIYAALNDGSLAMACNYHVMVTGVDIPNLVGLIQLHYVTDLGAFTQMLGRLFRRTATKTDGWVYQLFPRLKEQQDPHVLMSMGMLLGLADPSLLDQQSVQEIVTEQLKKALPTQQEQEAFAHGELSAYDALKIVRTAAQSLFAGRGWTRDSITGEYSRATDFGRLVAEPLGPLYTMRLYPDGGGRTRMITEVALPAEEAMARGTHTIERMKFAAQARAQPQIAAKQTISYTQWLHLAHRGVPGVPQITKAIKDKPDAIKTAYQEAVASGLTQAHYYTIENHLNRYKSNHTPEGGRMGYSKETGRLWRKRGEQYVPLNETAQTPLQQAAE